MYPLSYEPCNAALDDAVSSMTVRKVSHTTCEAVPNHLLRVEILNIRDEVLVQALLEWNGIFQ